jgi:N-acetylglucosaminyl-diphospho-decaprenol L-rhamnosyltransferase
MGLAALAPAPADTAQPVAVAAVRGRRARPRVAVDTPQLSVVIVNFCQWNNTARLTHQLRSSEAVRRGAAEVVIIDNHSPGVGTAKRLRKLSGVSVVRSQKNEGFAKAVNRGSRRSRGEWVLLLNPDVTVAPGFLDEVLEFASRFPAVDPDAGVIGFQMRHQDGSKQASAGVFPTLFRTLAGLCVPRSRRKCQHQSLNRRQEVPWVTGGCLLVRRDCFEHLDGLDESFFLYYEDVDFCRRARDGGWGVWYEPSLQVTHHFPLHTRAVPAPMRLVTRHALLTYAKKHWAGWQARVLGGVVWAEAKLRELLARRRNDATAEACFRKLGELVGHVLHGRTAAADAAIRFAAEFLSDVAHANDGKTQGEQSSPRRTQRTQRED